MEQDDEDDLPLRPGIDTDPDELEAADIDYGPYLLSDSFLISGPLLHGVAISDLDESRRIQTRAEARAWAKTRYGNRFIRMEHHPHRWVARVRYPKGHGTSDSSDAGNRP